MGMEKVSLQCELVDDLPDSKQILGKPDKIAFNNT